MIPQEFMQAVNKAETKEEAIEMLQNFAAQEREAFKKRLAKQHMTTSGVGTLLLTGALSLIAAGASYLLGAVEPELYAQGFAVVGMLVSGYLTWVQRQNAKARLETYDKVIAPMKEAAVKMMRAKYEAEPKDT